MRHLYCVILDNNSVGSIAETRASRKRCQSSCYINLLIYRSLDRSFYSEFRFLMNMYVRYQNAVSGIECAAFMRTLTPKSQRNSSSPTDNLLRSREWNLLFIWIWPPANRSSEIKTNQLFAEHEMIITRLITVSLINARFVIQSYIIFTSW